MGNLIWALAAILLLHLDEPSSSVEGPLAALPGLLFGAAIAVLAWILLPRLQNSRVVRRLVPGAGLATFAAALFVGGWQQGLHHLGVSALPWLGAILALLPFLLLHARSVEVVLQHAGLPRAARRAALRLRLELDLFPLLPFVFLDGFVSLGERWNTLRIAVEQVEPFLWSSLLLAVVALLLALPALVRWTFRLEVLPAGELRSDFEEIGRRLGFRYREIYRWPTGYQMANAAILGAGSRRIVLLTDLLLERLGRAELAAVFAHEAAHAVRHHVRRFAALGFGALLLAWSGLDLLALDDTWEALGTWCLASEAPDWMRLTTELVWIAGIGGAWYLVFGRLSRASEREADWVAAGAVGSGALFRSALLQVCRASDQPLHASGWRHDSPLQRVTFQQELERDPRRAARFESRLRRSGWWTLLFFLVAASGKLALYGPRFPAEWVRAELAWGFAAPAREHADWFEDPAERERVRALAVLAGEAPGDLERLRARAEELAERARIREAADALFLLRLRTARPEESELVAEEALDRAVFLREGAFRAPFERWRSWLEGRGIELEAPWTDGVRAYLEESAPGASGTPGSRLPRGPGRL